MDCKTAYSYDSYGYHNGACTAWESPLEPGVYHLPANATYAEPPAAESGKVAKWNGAAWALETDNRGSTCYATSDKSTAVISASNVVPDGYTIIAPPTADMNYYSWDAESKDWVLDSAAKAAAEKAATLSETRRAAAQTLLESYIASINTAYGLALTATMDYADAVADIAASSMTQAEAEVKAPYLKTLYDTLSKLGGYKA